MNRNVLTALLAVTFVFSFVILLSQEGGQHLLWNREGYAPQQPIAFSHRLHAGELQVDCRYCHFGVAKSRYAGVPAASVCMNCHRFVQATLGAVREEDKLAKAEQRNPRPVVSPEIAKIYDALGLDTHGKEDPQRKQDPIRWVRVYRVPDYVRFDHRPHVSVGLACQRCHGPVETMERVRQVGSLSMGWCVKCHRALSRSGLAGKVVHASTDCVTCHY